MGHSETSEEIFMIKLFRFLLKRMEFALLFVDLGKPSEPKTFSCNFSLNATSSKAVK